MSIMMMNKYTQAVTASLALVLAPSVAAASVKQAVEQVSPPVRPSPTTANMKKMSTRSHATLIGLGVLAVVGVAVLAATDLGDPDSN
jgi:hypothetical protein